MTSPPTARPNGPERRQHLRFPAADRLLGTLLDLDLPVRVRDVGAGGFSVETMEPLAAGGVSPIRFTAIDNWTTVLEAETLYCRPSISADGLPLFVTGYAFIPDAMAPKTVATLIEKVTSIRLSDDS